MKIEGIGNRRSNNTGRLADSVGTGRFALETGEIRNFGLAIILVAILLLFSGCPLFAVPAGGVIVAILLYFIAELLRNSGLFRWLGLPDADSMGDVFRSKRQMAAFIVRKSVWIAVPLLYIFLNPKQLVLADVGLLFDFGGSIHLVLFGILVIFSALMFFDARGMGITLITYLKSFSLAFLAAGFPEDLLVIGVVGGSVFRLLALYLPPLGAKIFTVLIVESLFCLAHIPNVRRSKGFYSEYMTRGQGLTYKRMFLQMFIISLPGWVFYFLSSHIYFSAWWHSLADIAAFLPKSENGTDSQD